MQKKKKTLETHKSKCTEKQNWAEDTHFLILIQIQNKIKITTTQIDRKNILIKNEDENIGTHRQHEIQYKESQGM